MNKPKTPTTTRRATRTIAVPVDLHDLLRIAALQESLRTKQRFTLQDIAEKALRSYLDQQYHDQQTRDFSPESQ